MYSGLTSFYIKGHALSTYAKLRTNTCNYQGIRKARLSGNLIYVLNIYDPLGTSSFC